MSKELNSYYFSNNDIGVDVKSHNVGERNSEQDTRNNGGDIVNKWLGVRRN